MNNTNNYVCVDNKYYDPYFILDVDQDDDIEYIIKAYKYKAKKYHPDKAENEKERLKNEKRFKILTKCIEFIKEKRETSFINTHDRKKEYKSSNNKNIKNFNDKNDLNNFNDSFIEKSYSKSKLYKKTSNKPKDKDEYIKEYNDTKDADIINQFKSKKFTNEKFNTIFDYNKLKNKKKENDEKQLIHYTTDGFYGYNTSDIQNYAMVRTFNGLLISDDLLETEDQVNYGNNYSDYNDIYKKHVKNPIKLVNITKEEEKLLKEKLKKQKSKMKKASTYLYEEFEEKELDNESEEEFKYKNQFDKEQYKLYKKNLSNLVKQQDKDKNIIVNSGLYDDTLIEDAENQILDMSPSLLRALDEHYKFKRLK